MPARDYWEKLFDVDRILDAFTIGPNTGIVAELGCGHGTFTIPVARRTGVTVTTFDIDSEMIAETMARAMTNGLGTIKAKLRDVATNGFGLPDSSCDTCLLFNILHGEDPVEMLRESSRILRPDGVVAIIHWRRDIPTPRGPNMAIRPSPEQIIAWAGELENLAVDQGPFLLPPWHYGIKLIRR